MSRPKSGELNFTGINKDKVPGDVPPDWYTDGRNVMFVAGETVRTPGEGKFANTGRLFAATAIHYVDTGPQAYWIYVSDAGVGVTDGTSHWNITPVGWLPITSQNRIYTVGDLNGVAYVNHPEAGPWWWNGNVADKMLPLPDWPAGWSCEVMRPYKAFLLAINIDTGTGLLEGQVSWSSSANPGQIPSFWVPSPTNDAGDVQFATPGGPLIDGLQVRDQFFVSKLNFTGVMQYVGGQYIMESRDVFPSTGMFAANCAIEHGNLVYMFTGERNLIKHDGTSITNLLYGVLQDYAGKQINYEFPSSVFVYADADFGQVGLAYPVGDDKACSEAVTVEALTLKPGIRDLPMVSGWDRGITGIVPNDWDSDSQAWDLDLTTWNESASGFQPAKLVFAGGANGLLEQGLLPTQIAPDGSAREMVAYIERSGIDLDDMDFRKTLSGMRPRMKGTPGQVIDFTIGGQESDSGAMDVLPDIAFSIGLDDKLDFFMDARLLSIRAASADGTPWILSGMFPLARKSGRW